MKHIENENNFKNLCVNKGIDQPSSVNVESIKTFHSKIKQKLSSNEFTEGILRGNRIILSQAITLIESTLPDHQKQAQEIIEKCLPFAGGSIRIGITGVPGVGKSTFIESFGKQLTTNGHKLAVLTIDPSSDRSKGSILGDKTRMEELAVDKNAYIRPSPTGGSLGGVARKTRETIILCEAAGFDTILIETVGVGQSETAVHSMTDFFLLLMLAGAGDELQGIKRGIMEMADAIAITKADGTNIKKAELAQAQYKNALHLFPFNESKWITQVLMCSAIHKTGISELWDTIEDYINITKQNGYFLKKRRDQSKYWMYETINESIRDNFYNQKSIKESLKKAELKVLNDKISSYTAAKIILKKYLKK